MRNGRRKLTDLVGKESEEAKVFLAGMGVLAIAHYQKSADFFTLSILSGVLTVYVLFRVMKMFGKV